MTGLRFDTVGWVAGRTSGLYKTYCHLSANVLFRNKWRKKNEGNRLSEVDHLKNGH